MKYAIVLLMLLPLAMAASVSLGELGQDEEIDKRMSFNDLLKLLRSIGISGDCVKACEANVAGFVQFLCDAACKIILEGN